MKKMLLVLVAILIVFIFLNKINPPQSRQSPSPSAIPTGNYELTGWFAAWDNDMAEEELSPIIDKFTVFSPMLYRVMEDGSLGRHTISNRDQIISIARDKHIPIAPVITDESDGERIQTLLYDKKVQDKFVSDLITEAEQENFIGWSIDIEKLTSKDKTAFSNFVVNLSNQLHKHNLKLYMIAFGREEDESYDPALSHDFAVFGKYADQVQLMTYGYNNEFTEPGGDTPLAWYRKSLQYTLQYIPREKIVVGLSTHGHDWIKDEEEFEGLTYAEVKERLDEENPDISFDEEQLSMKATYTKDDEDHILYFENAKTILEKMKIAKEEFGINKFAFWRLSAEDPELWKEL